MLGVSSLSGRVLPEVYLLNVLIYSSETIICKEKEKSRIRAIQMGNLKSLLNIRRMGKVPNVWVRNYGE